MPTKAVQFKFGKNPIMAADAPSGGVLNLFVFGEIGGWWGTNKNEVLLQLKGKKYSQINLVISSNGGDLAEALVMRDMFKAYKAPVTTYLAGLCASAATIFADAGDKVVMSKHCIYMVHKPLFGWTGGNADDLRKDADILDKWEQVALNIYESKTGMSRDELATLMSKESWLTADEALSFGFVDEVVETLDIDFEMEGEGQSTFMDEPIYFKNTKEVYNQAVTSALKHGYRQHSPAEMQGIKPNNNLDMKDLVKTFVSMLVTAGLLPENKQNEAIEAAGKLETPEMLASIVKEEVANQLKSASPSMKATDIVKLVETASDEDKAKIAEFLGVKEYDDKAISEKVEALAATVATMSIGEGGGQGNNGDSGFKGGEGKKVPSFKEKNAASMYHEAYESGHIDATTYKQLTGQEAPKRS